MMAESTIKKDLPIITASNVVRLDFEIYQGRLLLSLYSDMDRKNGLRADFDGTHNTLSLVTYANGVVTKTNRISFPQV